MDKVDIARFEAHVPTVIAAFALLELALVVAGIAVLQRRAPWSAAHFAECVVIEVAAIVVALAFNFAVLPRHTR
jgi:hypothetical protein